MHSCRELYHYKLGIYANFASKTYIMMQFFSISRLLCIGLLFFSISSKADTDKVSWADDQLSYCHEQIQRTVSELQSNPIVHPRSISKNGKTWQTVDIYDWTSGFWPGILWYNYRYSQKPEDLRLAQHYTELQTSLALSEHIPDHDIGFQMLLSYGFAYSNHPCQEYADIMNKAADKLAALYNPNVGTILSWPHAVKNNGWPHNTIMDNMMNLPLLFFAAEHGGNREYRKMAISHAEKTMHNQFRADYSSYHVALYDSLSGKFLQGKTNQGFSDNSCWARGQAWAIYGFTYIYSKTMDKRFLRFAEKITDAYLKRLPKDMIPYWDFDVKITKKTPKDASAAAIVASALVQLAQLEDNKVKAQQYMTACEQMLRTLSSGKYRSGKTNSSFLMHSTGNLPAGYEIDCSIIYADYYYIEALTRFKEYYTPEKVSRVEPFGVNLAGAEFFHKKMDGVGRFNKDYYYPTPREFDYWKSKGLTLMRIPFKWDRLQREVEGPLLKEELEYIRFLLREADKRGMKVLLDMHNYARRNYEGKYRIIGDTLMPCHFGQAWATIARELKDEPAIYGYGLMNEPHDMLDTCPWVDIAQVAIDSIRAVDTKTAIVVAGNHWSSSERWDRVNPGLENLKDPSDNLIFEAHCYFDSDASGIYRKGYDEEGAYPMIGVDRARPFVEWCKRYNKRGLFGEYGVPHNDERWLECLDLFLKYLSDNGIAGTYWSAGAHWNNYILGVHPKENYTIDMPQTKILQKYSTTKPASEYDVVVIGATPGGIMTAIEAARMGKNTLILERSPYIGGLPANGLGATDIATRGATTGLFSEFTNGIKAFYAERYGADSQQVKDCSDGFHFEPSVAAIVFERMIAAEGSNITVLTNRQFDFQPEDISVYDNKINNVRVKNRLSGQEEWYRAKVFVDATYEGDLAAAAGVPFRIGREPASMYNEPGAGKCYEYWKSLPAEGTTGEGDDAIQAYNYRLTLTDKPEQMVAFEKPDNYNRDEYASMVEDVWTGRTTWKQAKDLTAEDYEKNRAHLKAGGERSITPWDMWGIDRLVSNNKIPNDKVDANNQHASFISTDLPEENWQWPTASWEWRDKFAQRLRDYTCGLFWFAQHDEALPEQFRKAVSKWGLAKTEYEDNGYFPRQVYVREGRRFEGMYFFTAKDALPEAEGKRPPVHSNSITASHYALDSHAAHKREPARAHLDGFISYPTEPYTVPYGVIVPKEIKNLLFPVPVSGSHIGFSTLRMEPCWMALGQAAGAAAAIAIDSNCTVQEVDINALQQRLIEEGATIIYERAHISDSSALRAKRAELERVISDE